MENFNLILKKATESLHKEVENTSISKAIMSPALSTELYADYLMRSYTIQSAIEKFTFPVVKTVVKDIDSRVKTNSIINDLSQLNKNYNANEVSFLDGDYQNNLNFNLGLFYVTEGSVLGGQYILRNVKQALGSDAPGRFLNVYGDKTGSTWKSFLEDLNTYAIALSEKQRQEIIAGALYGFKRVQHIFSMEQAGGLKFERI